MKVFSRAILGILLLWSSVYAGVTFDGVDDFLGIGTNTAYNFSNTTFTVMGQFKSNNDDGYIFAKRTIAGPGAYFIRTDAAGTVSARLTDATGTLVRQQSTATTTLKDNAWHCFAVVFTTNTTTNASNNIVIYIDGSLDQGTLTGGSGGYNAGNANTVMGALSDADASGWLTGDVDDVYVYNTGLSAENISRYCSARMHGVGLQLAGKVSHWPLDQCGEGASGDGVSFVDRGGTQNAGGDNGSNNTGMTCHGSTRMMYPVGAD
jgi:hypothetical protein